MRHFLILLLAVSVGGTVLAGILYLIKSLLHKRISYRFAYYLWLRKRLYAMAQRTLLSALLIRPAKPLSAGLSRL